jgi:hypothetical protein
MTVTLLQARQHLRRRTLPGFDRAVQVALEVDRLCSPQKYTLPSGSRSTPANFVY